MKKRFFLPLILCLSASIIYAQSENILYGGAQNKVTVLSSGENYCKIQYTIGEVYKSPVVIDGNTFYTISIAQEGSCLKKGEPDLPVISRSIAISPDASMSVCILSSTYQDYSLKVAPSKGSISRNIDPGSVPYSFGDTYAQDQFYPDAIEVLGESYTFRDLTGISVRFYPVVYNPVTGILRVYVDTVIEVVNTAASNPKAQLNTTIDKDFHDIYKEHFLNYATTRYPTITESGRMLVICYDSYASAMQPFVDWKNSNGIPTTLVNVSTIGNNADSIKNYINTQYTSAQKLTFVLLVGDYAQVTSKAIANPGGSRNTVTDANYAQLSGNDVYPEVIVGRFSAESVSDVNIQVKKVLDFENQGEEAWYKKGIGLASAQGPGDDNEYDYAHMRNIRTKLMNAGGYTAIDEFYDGSQGGVDASGNPSASTVVTAINEGRGIINYIGHGNSQMWGTSSFTTSTVSSLKNDGKLPIVFSVACEVGMFDSNQICLGEAMLRAKNSSTGNPAGAVVFFGATVTQDWNEPMRAQDEFIDLLVAKKATTFGALCYMGCGKMLDEGGKGAFNFNGWAILGDPSLRIVKSTVATPEPTAVATPEPTPTNGLKGDVNGSGGTDIVDALLIAQYYVGLNLSNFNTDVADVNCSGVIDIIDALLIAQYYVGLISQFPC